MELSKAGTAYTVNGPTEAPVVVMIHGLGLTHQVTWKKISKSLAQNYRVLGYDLMGHGQTALPKNEVTLDVLSCQIIELMDELKIRKAALIGFSIGGMINRKCVMDNPDRVSALVILNSPHERGEEQQKLVEQRVYEAGNEGPAKNINQTIERWFTDEFGREQPDIVAQVRETVLANNHANYAAHQKVLAEGVKELIRPTPPITHPTLVMTTQDDSRSTPEMSYAIANEIKNAETVVVPSLKHLGLIQSPDAFINPIQKFLGEVLGGEQVTVIDA